MDPLRPALRANLQRSFDLYEELAAGMPATVPTAKLPGLRSNTVGLQLWCVIGARESYGRGIQAGRWDGFSCSVTREQTTSTDALATALARSGREFLALLNEHPALDQAQNQLLLDLLEHEALHQGQLIRYLYALQMEIPSGWKARYALE